MSNECPSVSVVIPSLHGREKNLNRLKNTVLNSGIPRDRLEIVSAIDVSPNGRARDVAVPETTGEYLICMDADVSFPDPEDLKSIVHFLESNPDVGLCGPAQQLPPDLPDHVRQRANQLPRTHVEAPDEFRETDMVTHACLALPRQLFLNVGMEHPNLISGTDPDLRHRVRKAGYKVGLVPDTRVYHPPSTTWSALIENNFKGGRRSRAVKREYPDYHLKADPDITATESAIHDGTGSRINRHVRNLLTKLKKGYLWALTAQICYTTGYVWEFLVQKQWVDPIPYPDPPGPEQTGWDQFLEALKEEGEVRWLHS